MSKEQDYKQSIQVTIRVRPPNQKELNQDSKICIKVQKQAKTLTITNNNESKSFAFDSICDSNQNQESIFHKVGMNSTKRCLEGYNCSIFAYGQTGAGKTFTMMGVNYEDSSSYQKRGLIPRTLQYLFGSIQKDTMQNRTEYLIKCTFLQIYNEQIIDLLNKSNVNLQIREDLKKGVYVEGLQEEILSRTQEAMDILKKGSKGRHVGSTHYNQTSSRSHSVFSMLLESKTTRNGLINMKSRRFHFIDLAGSQRTKLSNGERLKQGCSINKSLHVLGMVINSLVESTQGKPRYINYRDSKLTFLLKDALGGNSKTHLIANVSPVFYSYPETISTLTFARRVKLIKLNKVLINEDASGNLQALKGQIRRLKQEIIKFKSNPITEIQAEEYKQKKEQVENEVQKQKKQNSFERILLKNENKLNLQKLLQEYIEQSIEKQTKFEVELLKKEEKIGYLTQGINQYNRNQTHFRMIINLYEQKFKRMKSIELKLSHMIKQLDSSGNQNLLEYINKERQQLIKEINQYKQLLSETPFIKNLMKQNNLLIEQQKQDDSMNLSTQLSNNLNFLKDMKSKLDYNIRERNQINQLIENYSINKEEELSPKKRHTLEKEFQTKEKDYLEKIEQFQLEVAYLKGMIQQTELLLKESVDKQLNFEEKLQQQNGNLDELLNKMKEFEEKQEQKYNKLMKEKEQIQINLGEKISNLTFEIYKVGENLTTQSIELNQYRNKNKKLEKEVQQIQEENFSILKKLNQNEKIYKIQIQNLYQQLSTHKTQAQQYKIKLTQKNQQIQQINIAIQELNNTSQLLLQKNQQLESQLKIDKELIKSYQSKVNTYQQSIQKLRVIETNQKTQMLTLQIQISQKNTVVEQLEQTISKLHNQIQIERNFNKKRDDQFTQLLIKKQRTDNELQIQADKLKVELMNVLKQLQEKQILNQNIQNQLNEVRVLQKMQSVQFERQMQLKSKQIIRNMQIMQSLKEKQKCRIFEKQQIWRNYEELNTKLIEERQKIKKTTCQLERSKQKQKQLTELNSIKQKQIKKYQESNEQHQKSYRQLSENIKILKEILESKQKYIEKIKQHANQEKMELLNELDKIKQQSALHETNMKKGFEDFIANKQKYIVDLKTININCQNQLNELKERYELKKSKLKQIQQQNKELIQKIKQVQEKLSKKLQEMSSLRDQIEDIRNSSEQKMQERQNNYNEFIDKTNEKLDNCQIQLEKTKQLYQQLLSINLSQQQLITQNKKQISNLTLTIQQLNEQLIHSINIKEFKPFMIFQKKEEIIPYIKQTLQQLNAKELFLLQIQQQNAQLLNSKNSELKKIEEQLLVKTEFENKLKAQYDLINVRVDQLTQQLQIKNVKESNLHEKLTQNVQMKQDFILKIEFLEKEKNQIKSLWNQEKLAHKIEQQELNQIINDLQNKLGLSNQTINKLEQQIQNKIQSLDQFNKKVYELTQKNCEQKQQNINICKQLNEIIIDLKKRIVIVEQSKKEVQQNLEIIVQELQYKQKNDVIMIEQLNKKLIEQREQKQKWLKSTDAVISGLNYQMMRLKTQNQVNLEHLQRNLELSKQQNVKLTKLNQIYSKQILELSSKNRILILELQKSNHEFIQKQQKLTNNHTHQIQELNNKINTLNQQISQQNRTTTEFQVNKNKECQNYIYEIQELKKVVALYEQKQEEIQKKYQLKDIQHKDRISQYTYSLKEMQQKYYAKIEQYKKIIEQLNKSLQFESNAHNQSKLELTQKIQEAKQIKSRYEKQINNYQQRLMNLENALKSSKQKQEKARIQTNTVIIQLQNITEQLTLLKLQNNEQNKKMAQLKQTEEVNRQNYAAQLQQSQQIKINYLAELKQIQEKHQQIVLKLQNQNNNALYQQREVMQNQIKEIQNKLFNKQKQIDLINQNLQFKITELTDQLQHTKIKLQQQIQQNDHLLTNDIEKQKANSVRIQNLKHQNESLKKKMTQLYNELSDIQNTINKRQLDIKKTELEFQNQKKLFISNLTKQNQEIRVQENIIINLNQQKEILKNKNQNLNEEYKNKLIHKIKDMEKLELSLNEEKVQEIQKIKNEFVSSMHKLEQLNQEKLEMKQKQYQKRDSEIKRLEKYLKENRDQLMKYKMQKSDFEQKYREIEQKNSQLNLKNKELHNQMQKNSEQISKLSKLKEEYQQEIKPLKENNINLKKLLLNLEKQKQMLQTQISDKQDIYKRLFTKFTKLEQNKVFQNNTKFNSTNNNSVIKTAELLEKSRAQIQEYKKTIEQNNKTIKRLKNEMNSKQQTFLNIHSKAEEYCKNQEKKVSEIKNDYLKLENQHRAIIKEKEMMQSIKQDNQSLREQLASYKLYQQHSQKRIKQLQENVQIIKKEYEELKSEADDQSKIPYNIASGDNDRKLQYINKIKEQNNYLKRQKTILAEKLQNQIEEKKNLRSQLNLMTSSTDKRSGKQSQTRNSLLLLDNLSNNIQVTLKIELERKLAEIKYLQDGFAQLCILLGIKRLPENKSKGGESTKRLIMSAVEQMIKQLSEARTKLKQKEIQLDSKAIKMQIINKQYTHLKNKITEAKFVKDNMVNLQMKAQQNYHKRLPSRAQTSFMMKNSVQQSYRLNNEDQVYEDTRNKLRQMSKRRNNN